MITEVKYGTQLLAIIVGHNYQQAGIQFFTPNSFSQQMAYMHHPAGKVIVPHLHNPVPREVQYTLEVLFLKRGKLRVDFYNDEKKYLESRILHAGDTILLATGGHGFEVIEEIEMIEVKQGPHMGEADKTRFTGVTPEQIIIRQ